jgi:hypothetical protein
MSSDAPAPKTTPASATGIRFKTFFRPGGGPSGTTCVAPSTPAEGSGHLFYWNRRNIERWRQTHLADAQALRDRIVDRISKGRAT